MPFVATWMDLEIAILTEVSQRRRNTIKHPLLQNLNRNDTNELIYKTDSQTQEQTVVAKG